jgi:predicted glutamine amidotransferase
MCRLYGFRSNEPTKVECSLVYAQNALMIQSRSDMMGREHADGWGLASYSHDGEPTVEHRESAAFADLHFSAAAERVYAETVVAHVRRATVGKAATANTHPFRYRRWTFAHNGTVGDFQRLGERMVRETTPELQRHRAGTTDSEQAFLWLLTRMDRAGIDIEGNRAPSTARVADAVGSAVLELASRSSAAGRPSKLNFLLTDGRLMVASRFANSLYLLERDGVHDCEICGIPHVHHDSKRKYRAVVIASEPITDETWQEVPDGHLLSIEPGLEVRVEGIR